MPALKDGSRPWSTTVSLSTITKHSRRWWFAAIASIFRKRLSSPWIVVFFVGSEVVVTKGEYVGAQGRVLSSTRETVLLHDRKGQKAVEAPLECVQLAASAAVTDIKTRTGKDPNYHLIGQHVRVIKDNIFKDYEAIIKSTENHNFVSIEIQATMRRQRIQLSHLCLLSDPQMQPLDAESSLQKTVTREATSGSQFVNARTSLPVSSLPLTASTPLPPSTSVTFSPAWNPCSRTPDPGLAFAYNPWMVSEHLTGKPIRDPGWKYGDHEDKWGIWKGIEGSLAKIFVMGEQMLVPEKYVRHVVPELKSQVVVSLEGLGRGQEYIISEVGKDESIIGIRNSQGRIPPESKCSHSTSTLAVLAKK
ncbi:hypothetical protein FPV67DRAFT_1682687 [Lyophyllum atratum]|nr:hypothetical protein FPV67DRAFT_1682687 [Lyophyllum atratum]